LLALRLLVLLKLKLGLKLTGNTSAVKAVAAADKTKTEMIIP